MELKFRYICLLVVLVCHLVYNLLSIIYIISSRNGISVEEISFVNFLVGCTVFKLFMNFKSGSFQSGHIKKMSSMNLSHNMGCRGYVYTYFPSHFVMNKLAYKVPALCPWLFLTLDGRMCH